MRQRLQTRSCHQSCRFPFLFGGAFIEANFFNRVGINLRLGFPFLFGGAFIEAHVLGVHEAARPEFPFLFGGAFIEATLESGGGYAYP